MRTVPFRAGGEIHRPFLYAPRWAGHRAFACLLAAVFIVLSSAVGVRADSLEEAWTRTGQASWYGHEFARRRTASGNRFDPHMLTAAHRTLPFGTRVRVTNLHNGRSVLVTITDRGPFRRQREIDLSYGAARALGMVERGIARVLMELVES
jgi:rare lipoprotein A